MTGNTTETSTTHRNIGLIFALGAGIVAYAWRRKVVGKSMLPAIASAIAIASSAGAALQRFLPSSKAENDGRLAPEDK
jgi:hypothetical protein